MLFYSQHTFQRSNFNWQANWHLRNPEVHYRYYVSPPLIPNFSKWHSVPSITTHLLKLFLILRRPSRSKERFAFRRYSLIIIQKLNIGPTSFGTHLCLLFHLVAFDTCVCPLHILWPLSYSTRSRQHPSGLHHLRIVYQQGLLHFLKQKKDRRRQVQTVRRMLEAVTMELLTQQGLCLPGSMRTCTVVKQNNSTRELASSAR